MECLADEGKHVNFFLLLLKIIRRNTRLFMCPFPSSSLPFLSIYAFSTRSLFLPASIFSFTLPRFMGNCLASSKIVSQNAKLEQRSEEDEVLIKQTATSLASSRRESPKHAERGKAEMVRLGLHEGVEVGKDGEMRETTTRIRVVVTREELKQILKFRKNIKNSSVEEIIGALRLRERRADRGEIMSSSWKPVLDSIPEEH